MALVACAVPSASLAVVCSENEATNRLKLGGFEVQVPAAQGLASWRREPSFARLDRIPLPQPTTNYTIAAAKRDTSSRSDTMLVGTGCLSFPDLKSAWLAFTEGRLRLRWPASPSRGPGYHPHRRVPRLDRPRAHHRDPSNGGGSR